MIDGELVFPAAHGTPDFRGLQAAMASDRQHELAVLAFDLMPYHDGEDLRPTPLIERRLKLTELVLRSDLHCLHPVQAFQRRREAPRSSCAARAGGHRFEAPGVELPAWGPSRDLGENKRVEGKF